VFYHYLILTVIVATGLAMMGITLLQFWICSYATRLQQVPRKWLNRFVYIATLNRFDISGVFRIAFVGLLAVVGEFRITEGSALFLLLPLAVDFLLHFWLVYGPGKAWLVRAFEESDYHHFALVLDDSFIVSHQGILDYMRSVEYCR